jgi:hypothetical protein
MDTLLDGHDLCSDSRILASKDVEAEPRRRWNAIILFVSDDLGTALVGHKVPASSPKPDNLRVNEYTRGREAAGPYQLLTAASPTYPRHGIELTALAAG